MGVTPEFSYTPRRPSTPWHPRRGTHITPYPWPLSLDGRPSPPRRTTRPPTAHHTSKGTEAAGAVTVHVSSTGPNFSQESFCLLSSLFKTNGSN